MKTAYDPPVFVVGSARSGTTLMYSILQASGEFALYQAETLLLEVCRTKYGNPKSDKNYERFINDWTKSKQFYRSGLDTEEFVIGARDHRGSYVEFMKYFMECIAEKQGKKRWAEQTPSHIFNMRELSEAFPGAKFIHVIRDGRDVAVSRLKLGWTGTKSKDPMKSLIFAAKSWEISVKAGRAYGKDLGDNYLEVYYEDIIHNLDDVLEKVNNCIGANITRQMVESSSIGSLGKANTAFKYDGAGISAKNLGRWRRQLSDKDICILHSAIGDTLVQLGYETAHLAVSNRVRNSLEIKTYIALCPIILGMKKILREGTFLGRWTSSTLEIGLR